VSELVERLVQTIAQALGAPGADDVVVRCRIVTLRAVAEAAAEEVGAFLREQQPDQPYEPGDWTDALAAIEVQLPG
jgi:hypothetical protein